MSKRFVFAVVSLITLGASMAPAANVHFVSGPTFSVAANSLNVSGKLAGLGNKDIIITVEADLTANVSLFNPAGHFVPGQNKVPFRSLGEITISKDEIKNGNVEFSLSVSIAAPPILPTDLGAPNNNWHVVVNSVTVNRAAITVVQGGKVVLQQSFVP